MEGAAGEGKEKIEEEKVKRRIGKQKEDEEEKKGKWRKERAGGKGKEKI